MRWSAGRLCSLITLGLHSFSPCTRRGDLFCWCRQATCLPLGWCIAPTIAYSFAMMFDDVGYHTTSKPFLLRRGSGQYLHMFVLVLSSSFIVLTRWWSWQRASGNIGIYEMWELWLVVVAWLSQPRWAGLFSFVDWRALVHYNIVFFVIHVL